MKNIYTILLTLILCFTLPAHATSTEQVDYQTTNNTSSQPIQVVWPDSFYTDINRFIGKTVELNQRLYVVDNDNWNKYGEITLAPRRQMAPTQITIPGSVYYEDIITEYENELLILDDGSNTTYPTPRPWADANGTLRRGMYVDNLIGRFTRSAYGYTITPTETPQFEGNPRPTAPESANTPSNLRVCNFNLQYYLADSYGTGYGPRNEEEAARQHNKIVQALLAMDADIYGLAEIQLGQAATQKLVDALNAANPDAEYSYMHDGTTPYGSYTKVGFIYRSDRLKPIKNIQNNNTGVNNRKKALGFTLLENDESIVVMMNHFKAKSGEGKGDNADMGDGQGTYNGDRTREAAAIVTFANTCAQYFGDDDVLVIGDLNSYAKEDPIVTFTSKGYTDLLHHYHNGTAYSHTFNTTAGYLDHALANAALAHQVVYSAPFHINSDEPKVFAYNGYDRDETMYRCSDHDPIIVDINLQYNPNGIGNITTPETIIHFSNNTIGIANATNQQMSVYNIHGQLLQATTVDSPDYTFVADFPAGLYIVTLYNNETHSLTTHKLIVK